MGASDNDWSLEAFQPDAAARKFVAGLDWVAVGELVRQPGDQIEAHMDLDGRAPAAAAEGSLTAGFLYGDSEHVHLKAFPGPPLTERARSELDAWARAEGIDVQQPDRQAWEGEDAATSLLEEANVRIRQSETFAWAVPGLAIAAESFLLGATLSTNATPRQQAVASVAGIVILFAALQFLAKHAFNFRVYEAVMERSRRQLGLPFVTMQQLVGSPTASKERKDEEARIEAIRESFPNHVELARRGWLDPHPRWWRWARNYVARRRRAVEVWAFTILVLIGLDIAILVQALIRVF
jgi:hypothetical protein